MPAYILFDNVKVHDAELLGEYARGAERTVAAHNGRYLAIAPVVEPLEGVLELASPVLIEFPSTDAARDWYNSADYAPWKEIRHRACENTAVTFDGLDARALRQIPTKGPESLGAQEPGVLLDELLHLEKQGWQSLCDGTGAEFYGRVMTGDGIMVLSDGQVFDRQAVIDSLSEAPPWRTYGITGERVIATGDDQAILVYTGRAYREDDEPAFVAIMSSVYRRDDDIWRLALYQQTPIAK